MTIDEELIARVREIENEWIPMADGCRVAARVFLPEVTRDDAKRIFEVPEKRLV